MGYLIYCVLEGKIKQIFCVILGTSLVLLFAAFISAFLLAANLPERPPHVKSELTIEQSDDLLFISGRVINDGEHTEHLRYELEMERSGASGATKTAQSGRIQVEPGEQSGISTTRVNAGKGDASRIFLTITDTDENVVSTSNLIFTIK